MRSSGRHRKDCYLHAVLPWNFVAASKRLMCCAHPAPLSSSAAMRAGADRLGDRRGLERVRSLLRCEPACSRCRGTKRPMEAAGHRKCYEWYTQREGRTAGVCSLTQVSFWVCIAVPDVRMSVPRFHCIRFQWLSKKPGY